MSYDCGTVRLTHFMPVMVTVRDRILPYFYGGIHIRTVQSPSKYYSSDGSLVRSPQYDGVWNLVHTLAYDGPTSARPFLADNNGVPLPKAGFSYSGLVPKSSNAVQGARREILYSTSHSQVLRSPTSVRQNLRQLGRICAA